MVDTGRVHIDPCFKDGLKRSILQSDECRSSQRPSSVFPKKRPTAIFT